MGLKKGKTNNPNGRPKGALGKLTGDYRGAILDFLEDSFPDFTASMAALRVSGKHIEYVRAYIDLMKYGISPAQSKVDEEKPEDDDELIKNIIANSGCKSSLK